MERRSFVGAAAICPRLNLADILSLHRNTSIYIAESLALKAAVDMIISKKIFNAFVFSDFLSVLRSLTSCLVMASFIRVVLEIRNRLCHFLLDFSQAKVKFFWVPSHSGVRGNERVDGFAKLATSSDFSCEVTVCKIEYVLCLYGLSSRGQPDDGDTLFLFLL